jgi:succinylglutamate desuccinylase
MADKMFVAADIEHVWYRDSDVEGPTAIILGGVHGNERAGAKIIRRMLSGEFEVPLERGKLIIALGNVAAVRANTRFIEENLNRQFRNTRAKADPTTLSYEGRRAQALMPILKEADGSLDLHAFRQADGNPFIITEPRGFAAARAIGAANISSGWSAIEAGGTDGFMEENGKIGLCYELGQLQDLKCGVPRGERGVLRFLDHMQLIESAGEPEHVNPRYVHADKAILATRDFAWGPSFPYKSFQPLQPGELIASNGLTSSDDIYAGPNQVIIFPSSESAPEPNAEMFNLGTIFSPRIADTNRR